MHIEMAPYNPAWPSQFDLIKADLTADLASASLPLTAIEHIGSTSIPTLPSKPILDILIIIPQERFTDHGLQAYCDALAWAPCQPGYRYIGTGGVRDRWSFKLNGIEPRRNVYVAAEGSLPVRSCLAFRDLLRREQYAALREEYARVKRGLCEGGREWGDVMQYSRGKDAIVRKVLEEAGWSGSMVNEKERACVGGWEELEVVDLEERWWQRVVGSFLAVGRRAWGLVMVMGWWRGIWQRRAMDKLEREICEEESEEGW
ncbi:hypothetical protein N7G274_007278 [Stereocaulon virgatum]|uniref:Uncharacterized protein n=1 Tax=Stereocaulon virgatum TaxID=373712 RepID=A0ABR4A1X8_9LECA